MIRVLGSARQWSFIADEVSTKKTVVFIYDSDHENDKMLYTIIRILSKHAQVLRLDEGMDYILKQCS